MVDNIPNTSSCGYSDGNNCGGDDYGYDDDYGYGDDDGYGYGALSESCS